MKDTALSALTEVRKILESYIRKAPVFRTTLVPVESLPPAPEPVQQMINASEKTGVGPMAGVAGMVAQYVGEALLAAGATYAVVENGGDLFIHQPAEPVTVGVFCGQSPLSLRVGIRIPPDPAPRGVATSSGTVGPSLSFGKADAVAVISRNSVLADTAATAVGNLIQTAEDIERAVQWGSEIPGILGVLAIFHDTIAAWGDLELTEI
jgi:ApbE superfamily uncharacterized protein (UPF0280 family)